MSLTLEDIEAAIARKQSDTDISAIDQAIQAKEQQGSALDAFVEPALAVGSTALSTIPAGIAGLVQAINPFAKEGAGAQAVQAVQEAGTIQPQTEAGQAGLENLITGAGEIVDLLSLGGMVPSVAGGVSDILTGGDLASSVATAADIKDRGLSTVLADKVFEETESPLAATAVFVAPDLAETLFGALGAKSLKPQNTPVKEAFADAARQGGTEKQFIDNGAGFIVEGPAQAKIEFQEAVKQGFDPGSVTAIKGGNAADKSGGRAMIDILKKGRKDKLFAKDNRPSDIVGNAVMKRIDLLKKINKSSGEQLNKVAKRLKNEPVGIGKPVEDFTQQLSDFGVRLVDDGKGGFKADFAETSLAPGDRGPIKEVVRQLSRINKNGDINTLGGSHELKRIIDRNVSFGKVKTGLSGDPERVLKAFRADIDTVLDSNFPKYDAVNRAFASTRGALDDFQTAVGKSINLDSPQANKSVGTAMRGLTSNIKNRIALDDAMNQVEKVSKNFGGQFDDNIKMLNLIADEIDGRFPTSATTSLQGEQFKATEKALRGSKTEIAADVASAVVEKARGINDENAIKALEAVLQ